MDNLSSRIQHCMGTYSKRHFAKLCNVSPPLLQNYLDGSIPSADKVLSIAKAANVSVEWLISGEGEQHASSQDETICHIPRYDIMFAAGAGALNDRADILDYITISKDFLKREFPYITYNKLVAFTVKGDSMEPTIKDASTIIVDTSDNKLRSDTIMAIIIDDYCLVKRVHTRLDGFALASDNNFYAPIEVERDKLSYLQIVGRVVSTISKL